MAGRYGKRASELWADATKLQTEEKFAESLPLLKEFKSLMGENWTVWALIGDAHRKMGQLPEAETAFTRSIELAERKGEGMWAPLVSRARVLRHLGRRDEALTDLERATRLAKTVAGDIHYYRAVVHFHNGHYRQAQDEYAQASGPAWVYFHSKDKVEKSLAFGNKLNAWYANNGCWKPELAKHFPDAVRKEQVTLLLCLQRLKIKLPRKKPYNVKRLLLAYVAFRPITPRPVTPPPTEESEEEVSDSDDSS